MKKIFFISSLCLFIAGCATGHWEYSMPRQEAMRLAYDCQYMANMQAKGTGYLAPAIAQEQFDQCMRSRGFVWVQDKKSTTTNPSTNKRAEQDTYKKYKYGFVDIAKIAKSSRYLKKYYDTIPGDNSIKGEKTALELKKQALLYCKEYNYDFIIIKDADLRDFEKGYLCPPALSLRSENFNNYRDGDATGDMASFIDRTTGTVKTNY